MASNINVNFSSGSNTGDVTSNPQSVGQDSGLAGPTSNLQTSISTSSINNQSSGESISLKPAELRTAAITETTTKTTDHISATGVSVAAVLLVVAIASCVYIYLTSKRPSKNV